MSIFFTVFMVVLAVYFAVQLAPTIFAVAVGGAKAALVTLAVFIAFLLLWSRRR